jgi:hypothetical protein
MQRQVRLYLHTHGQQVPGNKGTTAAPTAAVVLSFEFIPIKSSAAMGSDAPGSYGVHSRVP